MSHSRRSFLSLLGASLLLGAYKKPSSVIMTINGTVPVDELGKTLIHEHFLVDFIGADKTNFNRWNRADVVKKVLPFLLKVKQYDVKTIFDCTPAYLGRDIELLKLLSDKSGVQLVTNTGYYGAVDNKYLPAHAFTESADQLAVRWINEFIKGIDGTGVRPGFIKISVNPGNLSELHKKLVKAAAITNKATGLKICSHTGPAIPAFQELEILKENNVDPSAFVWVHAQSEKDKAQHKKAATAGAWVSLDGIGWGDYENYADSLQKLKAEKLLNRVLISHDGGWYKPDEKEGGDFVGFTTMFTLLFPLLRKKGFTDDDFDQLLIKNPAAAFALSQ